MPPPRPAPAADRASARIGIAFAIDVVLVVAFAAIGRASHESGILGEGGLGLLTTAWPFVSALAIGWVVSRAWRTPLAPLRAGVPIWAATVIGGMLLRMLSGQGTALPFIIVATLTLLLLLVGWRAVSIAVRRRFT